ncbi:MAG: glycerate kinase [Candidatus Bathyarchaeia archaeon]
MIRNKDEILKNAGTKIDYRAREIVLSAISIALKESDPTRIVKRHMKLKDETLTIKGQSFSLKGSQRIIVVGAGKACGAMAQALEGILGDRISYGKIGILKGTKEKYSLRKIRTHEASHPIPDENSVEYAKEILGLLNNLSDKDLVLCLISGGGSALMSMPKEGISLEDKKTIIDKLLKAGARINELNAVRKHISMIKGGQLAKKAYPATLISLIVSDVVGDPIDVIASGPTAPDSSTYTDATRVLKKYKLWDETPASIKEVLRKGEAGELEETPKQGSRIFKRTHNFVIGNNKSVCLAVKKYLTNLKINAIVLTSSLEGEAKHVGNVLGSIAHEIFCSNNPVRKPAAIIAGGETTVTVVGNGKGGRNQELVLGAALKIDGLKGAVIASIGTDGIDGITDAAGAIADGRTVNKGKALGLVPEEFLAKNNTYEFFSRIKDLLLTGPTGTNLNDIAIGLVI